MPQPEQYQRYYEQQSQPQVAQEHPLVKGVLEQTAGPVLGHGNGHEIEGVDREDREQAQDHHEPRLETGAYWLRAFGTWLAILL